MKKRNITKSPAVLEDFARGIGTVTQNRAGTEYTVHLVDVPAAVSSEAELSALDVTKFQYARVYVAVNQAVEYNYDPNSTSGLPSTGLGTWVPSVGNAGTIYQLSTDPFPATEGLVKGTRLIHSDTYDSWTLQPLDDGTLGWVEDGNVGDEVDTTAASHLTLAQAQASNLQAGQYAVLTDVGNITYSVVPTGDTGGFYVNLDTAKKFKLEEVNTAYISDFKNSGKSDYGIITELLAAGFNNIVVDADVDIDQTIVSNSTCKLSFTTGKMTLVADIDFMWQQVAGTLLVQNCDIEDSVSYSSRSNLNRGFRGENADTVMVFTGLTRAKGFNNAIHGNLIKAMYVGQYKLTDVYGTGPQEGYGINSSAKYTLIGEGVLDNTAITNAHGRHAVYINNAFEFASIGKLYCKNFNRNPIQINPVANNEGRVIIDSQVYESVQVDPVSDRAGAINLTVEDSSSPTDVTVTINSLFVDGYDGCLVSCPFGGYPNSVIQNVRGRNNRELVDENTFNAIHAAGMIEPTIKHVKVDELVNNSVSVVRLLTNCVRPRVSDVSTASQTGRSVVAVSDTADYVIDAIDSWGANPIDRIDIIGSNTTGKHTINYNTDWVTIDSSDTTPDVRNLRKVLYSTGSPITLTDFLNGGSGQELFIFAVQGNVTIQASGSIDTISGDIVLGQREIAHLIRQGSRWVEVGH